MFVITLTLDDPEDANYFINKTLNKLHGYIQNQQIKLAIFFNRQSINIYANDASSLETLLKNEALVFDIRRNIYTAKLNTVVDTHIKVFKRVRNGKTRIKYKVNQQIEYCKRQGFIDKKDNNALHQERHKLTEDFKNKYQQKEGLPYFIIKNQDKRFTIWLEVREIAVKCFSDTQFNSYGLLHISH
jgi:hypothetical protein